MAMLTSYVYQDEEKKNYLSLHGVKFVYVQEGKPVWVFEKDF
jgi:hypothetical protein